MRKLLNLIIIGMCLLTYFVTISAASTGIMNNDETTTTPTEKPQIKQIEAPSSGPIPAVISSDEKTNVTKGEDIQFKLSLENFIPKPILHAQVTLIPPSGMIVSSSDFSESGNGQYTSKFDLEPGEKKDIEVKISANQVGSFDVKVCSDYYFGSEKMNVQYEEFDIPFQVSEPPTLKLTPTLTPTPTPTPISTSKSRITPGFGSIGLVSTIIAVFFIIRRV
jgi:uncharacterized repeat protein (TIGR01451 family)